MGLSILNEKAMVEKGILKLQYFGHLMQRVDSLEKTLTLGGIGGRRRSGWQRMRWLDSITDSMDMSLVNSGSWWWTGKRGMLRFMGWQRVGHDWTELNWKEEMQKQGRSSQETIVQPWGMLLATQGKHTIYIWVLEDLRLLPRERVEWWCWSSRLQSTKAWTLLTSAPTLR